MPCQPMGRACVQPVRHANLYGWRRQDVPLQGIVKPRVIIKYVVRSTATMLVFLAAPFVHPRSIFISLISQQKKRLPPNQARNQFFFPNVRARGAHDFALLSLEPVYPPPPS